MGLGRLTCRLVWARGGAPGVPTPGQQIYSVAAGSVDSCVAGSVAVLGDSAVGSRMKYPAIMMTTTTTAAMIQFCVLMTPPFGDAPAMGEDGTPGGKEKAHHLDRDHHLPSP